jgi:O-antigen ligase
MEDGRVVAARRWAGDIAAVVPLAAALLWLPGRDGGWGLPTVTVLAVACLPALAPAALEVQRLPRVAQWLLAAWGVGLAIGVVFAVHRADAVRPLLEYTVAPVILLATLRILRRPWGPGALLVGLLGAFARYQYDAFLSWWGWSETGRARWAPLSWWNQSAALMGMLGVLILGVAITSRRIVRIGLAALAGTAFAGVWLSGSRAGLAVTAGAVVVTIAVAGRSLGTGAGRWWSALATATASLAATALVVAGLLSMLATTDGVAGPAGGRDRIARADQSLEQNTDARLVWWAAAAEMWLDRPLTGQGVGSFGPLAFQWSDDTSGLSSSAHNEYLEVLAESGPLPALALVGVAVAAAAAVLGLVRRPQPISDEVVDLRAGLAAGGAGAAALFLVHAGVDFDWRYAALPAIAGIGLAAAMVARREPSEPAPNPRPAGSSTAVGWVGFGALVLVLAAGLAGAWWERQVPTSPDLVTAVRQAPPWDTSRAAGTSLTLLTEHRYPDAIAVLERARRWSPADPTLTTLLVQARYLAGDITATEAVDTIEQHPTWLGLRAELASTLIEAGEYDLTEQMLDRLADDLERRPSHLPLSARAAAADARIRLAAATEGCATAEQVLDDALAAGGMPVNADVVLEAALADACGTSAHS